MFRTKNVIKKHFAAFATNVKTSILIISLVAPLAVTLVCFSTISNALNKSSFSDRTKMERIPAIYIQHVGESDKPIFPVVISTSTPPMAELKRILGKDDYRHAIPVYVSETDLNRITASVKSLLISQRSDSESTAFGTFRVTVVESAEELAQTLSPSRIAPVLSAIKMSSDTKNETLQKKISSIERRLGKEAEK